MKRVVPTKTERRCKLCAHPKRDELDALLLRRSEGETDEQGRRINLEYVLERFREEGVENPTKENITVHFGKHCELVAEEEAERREEEVDEIFRQLLEGGPTEVDVDAGLKAIFKHGLSNFLHKVKDGTASITPDQMVKIADALARRRQNEAQAELLGALTGGVSEHFRLQAGTAGELPSGDVIEGEIVGEAE